LANKSNQPIDNFITDEQNPEDGERETRDEEEDGERETRDEEEEQLQARLSNLDFLVIPPQARMGVKPPKIPKMKTPIAVKVQKEKPKEPKKPEPKAPETEKKQEKLGQASTCGRFNLHHTDPSYIVDR
jgi:hypothetical protein